MIQIVRTAGLGLCAALMLAATQSAAGSPRKTPKGSVLCLPPGSTSPRPCASLAADSRMAFRPDSEFDGRAILRFRPRGLEMEGKAIDVPLGAGSLRRGQLYQFSPPRQLCAGGTSARSGQQLQFEIQVLTSDLQNADSVGFFQMRCN